MATKGTGGAGAKPRRYPALRSGFNNMRDIISYGAGLIVIAHEVFFSASAEPAVIAVGVSLLGLPIVFGADERRKADPHD